MYDITFSWAAALPDATRKPIVQVSNELIASLQSTCLFMICFFVFFRETTATTRLLASSTRRNMTIGGRPGGAGLRQACDPCRQGLGRQPVHSLSAFLPLFGSLHAGWRLPPALAGPAPGSRPSHAARMGGASAIAPQPAGGGPALLPKGARHDHRRQAGRSRAEAGLRSTPAGTWPPASAPACPFIVCLSAFFRELACRMAPSARSGGPGARVPSEPCGEDGRRLCHGAPDRERRASHFEKPSQRNSMSTNGGLAESGVQNGGSS